ncbi:hypothetical protein OS965_41685 [Streptomyces sp. H27-G5]|uniref:hypothetical protein n=1 Tax=Streptomyces sp. H27-G5 TaxID=2996698 RepID=UPI00226FD17B|nr:hypothetical protein [Streptomyces sp. H27-G5]MCY0924514.1 hypothetical protein [Streptomyces sp. H27-G5]
MRYIPAKNFDDKWEEGAARMRASCESAELPSKFLYFNDDFFVMQPIEEIPILHLGSLWHHIERYQMANKYEKSLLSTYEFLQNRKTAIKTPPISYETHLPLPIEKSGMLDAIRDAAALRRPQYRSLYGNLCGIGGTPASDVKIFSKTAYAPYGPFASTDDSSFKEGVIGEQLRATFSKPCRYEK